MLPLNQPAKKNSESSKTMLGAKHTENSEDQRNRSPPNEEKGESTIDDTTQADESKTLRRVE